MRVCFECLAFLVLLLRIQSQKNKYNILLNVTVKDIRISDDEGVKYLDRSEVKSFIGLLLSHHRDESKEKRCFSFEILGSRIYLCARCSCLVIGILIFILSYSLYNPLPLRQSLVFLISLVLIIPIGVDGSLQYLGIKESNNKNRIATGFAFGIGIGFVMTSLEPYLRLVLFIFLIPPLFIILSFPELSKSLIQKSQKVI